MQLNDVTVEVRDKTLTRIGLILPQDLTLKVYPVFNDVGAWELTLAADHDMAQVLRQPGAGIIVTGPNDVILSGPVESPSSAITPDDPGGTVVFTGCSDDIILQDRLSYPKPDTDDVTAQTIAHDERTGDAESLLHAYVNVNVGPGAVTSRKNPNLTMGTNGHHGSTITKKPRFQQLLNLLQEIAAPEGLRFRVVQRGDVLVFETSVVNDRTALIRLDARNGTLAGQKVKISAPGITRAVVAGQGEQEDRTFIEVSNAASLDAEDDWGRRIEVFKDQRNTDDPTELTTAGNELLADNGYTRVDVQAIPSDDDNTMRLGIDWDMGDTVTVVVEDQELAAVVTGLAMLASKEDGFKVGALIGDPTGFSLDAALRKHITSVRTRVSNLERNAEVSATLAGDVSDLQSDVSDAQSDITTAQSDITTLQGSVAALDTRIDALEAVQPRRQLIRTTTFNLGSASLFSLGGLSAGADDLGDACGIVLSGGNTLTVGAAGLYRVYFQTAFDANASNVRQVTIYLNCTLSSGVISGGTQKRIKSIPGSSVAPQFMDVTAEIALAAGDKLNFGVFQNSGSSLAIGSTSPGGTVVEVRRIGPA